MNEGKGKMPSKWDGYRIPRELNRSIKVSDADREYIREKGRQGRSGASIAREFAEVYSSATIYRILTPEIAVRQQASQLKRLRKNPRSTVLQQEYLNGVRRYKQSIADKLIKK